MDQVLNTTFDKRSQVQLLRIVDQHVLAVKVLRFEAEQDCNDRR